MSNATFATAGAGGKANQGLVTSTECTPGSVPVYQNAGNLCGVVPDRPASGLGSSLKWYIPLLSGRNDGGTVLDATGAAGNFKVVNTTGTSLLLRTENANNNTKTDKWFWEGTVPWFYNPNDNLNVTVTALHAALGTIGTHTVLADLYLLADGGTSSATLNTTSATSTTTSSADYAFAITGTTLTPGARIAIRVTAVIQETASGGNNTIDITNVRLGS